MPAKDSLLTLRALSGWMRDVGAVRARLPDGTELELGPSPTPARSPVTPRDPAKADEAERQRRHRVLFAATSTKPPLPAPPPKAG